MHSLAALFTGRASLSGGERGKGKGARKSRSPGWTARLWACLGRLHVAPRPCFLQLPQGTKSSGVILSSLPRAALKGQHFSLRLMITCWVTNRPRCQCVWGWVGGGDRGVAQGRAKKRPKEEDDGSFEYLLLGLLPLLAGHGP